MKNSSKILASFIVTVSVLTAGVSFLMNQDKVAGISQYPQGVLPPAGYGVTNPNVTQANINDTICKANWTATIRPSTSYTNALKKKQLAEMGYSDQNMADYEADHLISLQLGGHPTDPSNIWPELYTVVVNGENLGARQKDVVESALKREVCRGDKTLEQAQHIIVTDWVTYFRSMHTGTLVGGIDQDDE